MTTGFLLHDLGSEAAGAPWRAALPAGWRAPDLPGHGSEPAPRHGAYDPLGPATLARWSLGGEGVVVGVGQNAHAALIVAAGSAASAAAVVDGLWGPWVGQTEAIDGMYASLRRILDDPGAVGPAPRSGLDPRAAHGYGVHVSPDFLRRFWGAVSVPVLAVETPASATPADEREERLRWFGGPVELALIESSDPSAVVPAIVDWAERLAPI